MSYLPTHAPVLSKAKVVFRSPVGVKSSAFTNTVAWQRFAVSAQAARSGALYFFAAATACSRDPTRAWRSLASGSTMRSRLGSHFFSASNSHCMDFSMSATSSAYGGCITQALMVREGAPADANDAAARAQTTMICFFMPPFYQKSPRRGMRKYLAARVYAFEKKCRIPPGASGLKKSNALSVKV